MNRISKMLLLLVVVAAPAVLFFLDNQQIIENSLDTATPINEVSENVAYSNFTLAE